MLDLGSSVLRCVGSSPIGGTNKIPIPVRDVSFINYASPFLKRGRREHRMPVRASFFELPMAQALLMTCNLQQNGLGIQTKSFTKIAPGINNLQIPSNPDPHPNISLTFTDIPYDIIAFKITVSSCDIKAVRNVQYADHIGAWYTMKSVGLGSGDQEDPITINFGQIKTLPSFVYYPEVVKGFGDTFSYAVYVSTSVSYSYKPDDATATAACNVGSFSCTLEYAYMEKE